MERRKTAAQFWTKANTVAENIILRVERYAALTIPKVCLPKGFDEANTDQSHDYQSIGAQAVNHVVNKLMLALFAPSRPFIKLMAGKVTKAQATKGGMTDVQLNEILAQGERDAVKELDAREISLPERSSMLHRTDFHDDYQTVMAYKVSEVIDAIRATGIRIKGE